MSTRRTSPRYKRHHVGSVVTNSTASSSSGPPPSTGLTPSFSALLSPIGVEQFSLLLSLPNVLLGYVCSFLVVNEHIWLSSTCRLLRPLKRDPSMWLTLWFMETGGHSVYVTHFMPDDSLGHVVRLAVPKDPEAVQASWLQQLQLGHFSGLEKLDLSACEQLTDEVIIGMAKKCPRLKYLDVCWKEMVSCAATTRNYQETPQLTTQFSTWCKLTDAAMVALSQNCPGLTHLNVGKCYKLTDAGISSLARHCPQLKSLNLSWCDMITGAAVTQVAKHCPNLTELNVNQCELSDATIQTLAESCPRLTSIDVSQCYNISDAAIAALGTHCPHIRSFKAASCEQLSDEAVKVVAENCKKLIALNVSWCPKITNKSVPVLVRHCSNLRTLDVTQCKISDNNKEVICAAMPKCDVSL